MLVVDARGLIHTAITSSIADCEDIAICAELADPDEIENQILATAPQVILVNGISAVIDPVTLITRIAGSERPAGPGVLVLIDTGNDTMSDIWQQAHASAISVGATPRQLRCAVRLVAAGYLIRPTCQFGAAASDCATSDLNAAPASGGLSAREYDVLELLAVGRSNAQIALDLSVSESTVKTHVQSLLKKLGVPSRLCAVIYAYESGVVPVRRRQPAAMAAQTASSQPQLRRSSANGAARGQLRALSTSIGISEDDSDRKSGIWQYPGPAKSGLADSASADDR